MINIVFSVIIIVILYFIFVKPSIDNLSESIIDIKTKMKDNNIDNLSKSIIDIKTQMNDNNDNLSKSIIDIKTQMKDNNDNIISKLLGINNFIVPNFLTTSSSFNDKTIGRDESIISILKPLKPGKYIRFNITFTITDQNYNVDNPEVFDDKAITIVGVVIRDKITQKAISYDEIKFTPADRPFKKVNISKLSEYNITGNEEIKISTIRGEFTTLKITDGTITYYNDLF